MLSEAVEVATIAAPGHLLICDQVQFAGRSILTSVFGFDAEAGRLQWHVRRPFDMVAVGASRGVLVATRWMASGATSFSRGVWGISAETGCVLWTSHDSNERVATAGWWGRLKSMLTRRWDAPHAVHDGTVLCESGRVLDIDTGARRPGRPGPELLRRQPRTPWLDRGVVGHVAFVLPDAKWEKNAEVWLAVNGIERRSASCPPTGGDHRAVSPCMQRGPDWKDAAGRIVLSGQSIVAGAVGIRIAPSDPGVWRPSNRCALELVQQPTGAVLFRRDLHTPPGDLAVRIVPHALGVLVLTSVGAGRRQVVEMHWRRWSWSTGGAS